MAFIQLSQVGVVIPIYTAKCRLLSTKVLQLFIGGALISDQGSYVSVCALRDLNFQLSDGDRVGLIGHNGSGKSTLLRVLSRAYTPTHGQVHLQGRVGSLIDITLGIDHEATGRENIYLRCAMLGISKAETRAMLDEIIKFSELDEFIDLPMRTYSSGMLLRLAFSVSTLIRPEILLMDEWLAVGDERFMKKTETRLEELVESTKILVIASHSRNLIMKTCNRVLWLEHGAIKMDGTPEEVCTAYFG